MKESWQQWVIQPFRRKSDKEWSGLTSTPVRGADHRIIATVIALWIWGGPTVLPAAAHQRQVEDLRLRAVPSKDGGPGKGRAFDMGKIVGMIRSLARDVAANGLGDVVISTLLSTRRSTPNTTAGSCLRNWSLGADDGTLYVFSTRSFAGAESANTKAGR